VARWLWPHHSVASVLQKNLLREIGWSPSVRAPGNLLPPEQFTKQLHYQRTVRGHHFAVYCIAFDRSGRRIITGSDDRLVKVGLLCPCQVPVCAAPIKAKRYATPPTVLCARVEAQMADMFCL
jgi:hypothetical protein